MVHAPRSKNRVPGRPASGVAVAAFPDARFPERRRRIPFRMLADAFAAEDEELAPEPEWNDFAAWNPSR